MVQKLLISGLIILVAVLGIIGSIGALFLTNIKLNVGSYMGIKMIVGILEKNAMFTTNQFLATHRAA